MPRPSTPLVALLWLLIGYVVAGPDSNLKPRAVRSSACQDHTSLHGRLDVVEKKVEETVGRLEAELSLLQDAINAPEWSPLLDTSGKTTVDIFDDPPGDTVPSSS